VRILLILFKGFIYYSYYFQNLQSYSESQLELETNLSKILVMNCKLIVILYPNLISQNSNLST